MGSAGTRKVQNINFREVLRQYPYGSTSSENEVDRRLGTELENIANNFDSNIKASYSRTENVIFVSISQYDPRTRSAYDLSAKSGNEFKKLIKQQIESHGLEVEKIGKHKSDRAPEFWFRLK